MWGRSYTRGYLGPRVWCGQNHWILPGLVDHLLDRLRLSAWKSRLWIWVVFGDGSWPREWWTVDENSQLARKKRKIWLLTGYNQYYIYVIHNAWLTPDVYNFIMIDILNSCSSSMSEHNTLVEGGFSISRLLSEMRRDFSLINGSFWFSAQVSWGSSRDPWSGWETILWSGCPMSHRFCWLVVLDVFYFHPYLGKIPILTNIFQMGWNHQLVLLGAWEDEDETSDPQIVVHISLLLKVFCWWNLRRCPNGLRMQEDSCMLSSEHFQIFIWNSRDFILKWKQNINPTLKQQLIMNQICANQLIASNLVSWESPYHHVALLGGVVRRSKFGRSRPRWDAGKLRVSVCGQWFRVYNIPSAPQTMNNIGFCHLKTRLFTTTSRFRGFVEDEKTAQLYGDYKWTIGSLLNNQKSMESKSFFFSLLIWWWRCSWITTLPETNNYLAPEHRVIHPRKETIIFQASIFRGLCLLVSGRVDGNEWNMMEMMKIGMGGMGVENITRMRMQTSFLSIWSFFIISVAMQWLCRCFYQDTVVAHVSWDVSCMENTWRNEGRILSESYEHLD